MLAVACNRRTTDVVGISSRYPHCLASCLLGNGAMSTGSGQFATEKGMAALGSDQECSAACCDSLKLESRPLKMPLALCAGRSPGLDLALQKPPHLQRVSSAAICQGPLNHPVVSTASARSNSMDPVIYERTGCRPVLAAAALVEFGL